MGGNPKGSFWRSTPQANRKRPGITFTLSPEAVAELTRLAKALGTSRSDLIERLILGWGDELLK